MQTSLETRRARVRPQHGALLRAFSFLLIAVLFDWAAGQYVTHAGGVSVPDVVLDRVPAVNVSFVFKYGFILCIAAYLAYPLLARFRAVDLAINQLALLLLVRGLFIIPTRLEPPAGAINVTFPFPFSEWYFKNDLFFSGHVAVPFLGALVFGGRARYFFFGASVVMAISVLLMHIHYTVDVLGAYCITFTSYKAGKWLFRRLRRAEA